MFIRFISASLLLPVKQNCIMKWPVSSTLLVRYLTLTHYTIDYLSFKKEKENEAVNHKISYGLSVKDLQSTT